ncbi:hypothetical protein PIB30_118279 [Stylosanthes scabra]|uniref:Uncharacterized protein n=1 Tax=Stylosanthes scabra TaxID=79078 RepID=A0ABU6SKA0_9FABA|nr:hypothetical protein [Stylosanthes scabra]
MNESCFVETSPDFVPEASKRKYSATKGKGTPLQSEQPHTQLNQKRTRKESERYSAYKSSTSRIPSSSEESEDESDEITVVLPKKQAKGSSQKTSLAEKSAEKENGSFPDISSSGKGLRSVRASRLKVPDVNDGEHPVSESDTLSLEKLREENCELKKRLERKEEEILGEVLEALKYEKERCKSLETQLRDAEKRIEDLNKEQENLIDVFSEERDRRDAQEKSLRKKLQDASNTIQELLDKVRLLEKKSSTR